MSLSKMELPEFGPDRRTEVQEFELPRFKGASTEPGFLKFNLSQEDYATGTHQATKEADPQETAARVLAEAYDKAALIAQEAHDQGYTEGFREGRAAGEKSLTEVTSQFQAALQELERQKQALWEQREADLLRLTIAAARRVIETEVKTRPELINQALKTAYHYLMEHEGVRVRLAPAMLEWLSKNQDPLDEELEWLNNATLVGDARIAPGGVILETESGDVDATVETRWQAVSRVMEEVLNQAANAARESDEPV